MKPPRLRRIKPTLIFWYLNCCVSFNEAASVEADKTQPRPPGDIAGLAFNEAASVEADKTPRGYPTDLEMVAAGLARTSRYGKTTPAKRRIHEH